MRRRRNATGRCDHRRHPAGPSEIPEHAHRRCDQGCRNVNAEGGGHPELPPEQPIHLQHRAAAGQWLPGTGEVPAAGPKGLLRTVRCLDGLDARLAGIPSRVSVGFLPGRQNGDRWEVSIRDMHAWPELYFTGYGWVRFEPTPGSVTGSAPPWTVPNSDGGGDDPSSDPSSEASSDLPSESATSSGAPSLDPTTTTGSAGFWTFGRSALAAGIGVVSLLILAAPATIRVRRRTARLSPEAPAEEQVESAWAEIRDTVVDYGGQWPAGSPRAIGREVGAQLDQPESSEMATVATLVERSRCPGLCRRGSGSRSSASDREYS